MSATPSFTHVYQAELDYVWNSLRRLGVPASDLEDVAQDVFVVVHRRLADYDATRPLRPWLFGIAYRVVSEFHRRPRHKREVVTASPEAELTTSPEDELTRRQDLSIIGRALATLSLQQKAVFVMADIEGRGVPEIAEALAIPLNTAYSRLRLAREAFTDAAQRLLRERGKR